MFRLALIACLAVASFAEPSTSWYERDTFVYQIYPRSFHDSNGDGIGDLFGIWTHFYHILDIGARAIWLSPIYKSPQVDFGYDISNFTEIDPDYGTLHDFKLLVNTAHFYGIRVIMDFVPNHSSHEHPWFKKSVQKIKPYDEYYVWRDAKIVNGTRYPPNNWLSTFQGSAWQWNDQRKQYYLHQFAAGQPDLNYRSAALRKEMENVLTFWLEQGVDGFRIDAINHMFEDVYFRDEPKLNNTNLPSDDYDILDHIYTKNQNETYDVLKSWRKLMDDYANKTDGVSRMILTEAYAPHNLTIKFYDAGSTVPFNFMFMTDLNKNSTALDFKKAIEKWISSVPKGKVANWVVGNHDNHRVASRFGSNRADQITMLAMILPGIAVVYNGDEIGMEDRNFTYGETVDPAGCNAGPKRFHLKSRDPARTPFQWDATANAGFSNGNKTWLPVHSNYRILNLVSQKFTPMSHYYVFKALVDLKYNNPALSDGSLELKVVNNTILSVVRRYKHINVALLINFSDQHVIVEAAKQLGLPPFMTLHTASVGSTLQSGWRTDMSEIFMPAASSVVYVNRG